MRNLFCMYPYTYILASPASGEVVISADDVKHLPEWTRIISLMPYIIIIYTQHGCILQHYKIKMLDYSKLMVENKLIYWC